jgi:peptide/nickel transport system substrate-binding protein
MSAAKTVYAQIQMKPDVARPLALLDVRFRQALSHGIDRQAIVDAVLDGEPGMAETLPSREVEYYSDLDRVLMKYPLDHRRGEQLLLEMGLAKDGEGFYGQGGQRATVTIMTAGGGGGYAREALVLADGWKRMGIDTTIRILSPTEQLDQLIQAHSPALRITQYGLLTAPPFQPFNSANRASAETRWAGNNKAGYYDPELDRLSDIYNTALDRNERNQAAIQGMKLLSENAGYLPFYYGYNVVAQGGSLVGPSGTRQDNALWKLEEWRLN